LVTGIERSPQVVGGMRCLQEQVQVNRRKHESVCRLKRCPAAGALLELALQFEAAHFAQIRRYYQSITPTSGIGPRQRDPSGKQRDRNGRNARPRASDSGSSLPAEGRSSLHPAPRHLPRHPTDHQQPANGWPVTSGHKRTPQPPAARKFNPLVLSEIQNAGDSSACRSRRGSAHPLLGDHRAEIVDNRAEKLRSKRVRKKVTAVVKDKNFWSVRVNDDIRLIVHRLAQSLMLCYVDHHDKAYDWAGRRKLETHPKTGAAQLVEIRETVREIIVPLYVDEAAAPRGRKAKTGHGTSPALLFAGRSDDELLGYGVPAEWLADVKAATSATLEALTDHLPAEAAEALLEIATGGTPRIAQTAAVTANAFDHPDALRRFPVMGSVEELRRALDFPWDKWTVFLHPDQKDLVERH
jgi:hypothetical protein